MLGLALARLRHPEHVGAEKLKELPTCRRNAQRPPLADTGRLDAAEASYGGCSAQPVNDLGVIHGTILGFPTDMSIGIRKRRAHRLAP